MKNTLKLLQNNIKLMNKLEDYKILKNLTI